jgi:phytoene dehydrogenase-like protein
MQGKAVVIGSGPNGLSAAIVLAQAGFDVEVREAEALIGGGARSAEITLPGFVHDLGSAVHPWAVSSPFFSNLPLKDHGLKWIWPDAQLAHPLGNGTAVLLESTIDATVAQFGKADAAAYRHLIKPLVDHWHDLFKDAFQPAFHIPRHPVLLGRFGLHAIQPATLLGRAAFRGENARALFAGSAAHSVLRLQAPLSSAFGLMMNASGHAVGWPMPQGGAQSITNALAGVLKGLGGTIVTNAHVNTLEEVKAADLVLCDVTPQQFLKIADKELRGRPYRDLLKRYRYGPGIFKMDWALREPIPWTAQECRRAATVHVGGTLAEIARGEGEVWEGKAPERPFVLLVQPTLFDPSRAPAGRHTAWAYCHVPNGWPQSMVEQIENQIERFAPGFRDCVLARNAQFPAELQAENENLVGGDVVGGVLDLNQFVFRPTWRTYGTPLHGVYLCSASTPPGGAVHGLCGYYAARRALAWFSKHGGRCRR